MGQTTLEAILIPEQGSVKVCVENDPRILSRKSTRSFTVRVNLAQLALYPFK